mmetsp:Transcript_9406/g.22222  ORF Transcript_9406/g.22222 Transcript_9406/m.22222 type:complete len:465 (-) Transcript_9406:138-1532(-)
MVSHHIDILVLEIINILLVWIQENLGKGSWCALQLFLEWFHVIQVHVGISQGMYQVSRLASRHVGHQVGEQGIGGNVKGNSQSHVGRTLVHVTGNFILFGIHVELAQQMTGRECHFLQSGWIPSAHENPTIFWIVANLVNAVGQLIDTLTFVISVHVLVFGPKMPPLKAIDGSQVTLLPVSQSTLFQEFLAGIAIPNMDFLVAQLESIGGTGNEPEQFFGHPPPKGSFGGEQRQFPIAQIKAHLSTKQGLGTSSSAVALFDALLQDFANQIQVLFLLLIGSDKGLELIGQSIFFMGWRRIHLVPIGCGFFKFWKEGVEFHFLWSIDAGQNELVDVLVLHGFLVDPSTTNDKDLIQIVERRQLFPGIGEGIRHKNVLWDIFCLERGTQNDIGPSLEWSKLGWNGIPSIPPHDDSILFIFACRRLGNLGKMFQITWQIPGKVSLEANATCRGGCGHNGSGGHVFVD